MFFTEISIFCGVATYAFAFDLSVAYALKMSVANGEGKATNLVTPLQSLMSGTIYVRSSLHPIKINKLQIHSFSWF